MHICKQIILERNRWKNCDEVCPKFPLTFTQYCTEEIVLIMQLDSTAASQFYSPCVPCELKWEVLDGPKLG